MALPRTWCSSWVKLVLVYHRDERGIEIQLQHCRTGHRANGSNVHRILQGYSSVCVNVENKYPLFQGVNEWHIKNESQEIVCDVQRQNRRVYSQGQIC